jgi:hypothetical protein
MTFSKAIFWVYIFGSLLLGAAIGAADYYSNQMILITILLFVPNAFLGYRRPQLAWLNALSCFIGFVFLEIILGPALDIPPVRWPYFNFLAVFVTPIPAFIGSYWGAAMRWLYDTAKRTRQNRP